MLRSSKSALEQKAKSPRARKSQRALRLSGPVIVTQAIAMIERDGLANFSARKLAASLNCEAMSLYHYFRNMDVLLDAIVDTLLANMVVDGGAGTSAECRLRNAALTYLALAEDRPNAFQLVATRRWRTPNALTAVRTMVDCFIQAGLPPPSALGKSRILAAYLNGAGLAIAAWRLSDGSVAAEAARKLEDVDPSALTVTTVTRDLHVGLESVIAAVLEQ